MLQRARGLFKRSKETLSGFGARIRRGARTTQRLVKGAVGVIYRTGARILREISVSCKNLKTRGSAYVHSRKERIAGVAYVVALAFTVLVLFLSEDEFGTVPLLLVVGILSMVVSLGFLKIGIRNDVRRNLMINSVGLLWSPLIYSVGFFLFNLGWASQNAHILALYGAVGTGVIASSVILAVEYFLKLVKSLL